MAGPSGIDTNEPQVQSESRYLIRQPRALQWFENGRLVKRRDEERQSGKNPPTYLSQIRRDRSKVVEEEILIQNTGRFELFLDLLYIAILSNFADTLTEDISGAKLAKYIVRI